MKKSILSLVALLFTAGAHAVPLNSGFSMACSDGSFAYNNMNLEVFGNTVTIVVSGETDYSKVLDYAKVVSDPASVYQSTLTIQVPVNSCTQSLKDRFVLSCSLGKADIKGTAYITAGKPAVLVPGNTLNNALLQVRKISEVSLTGQNIEAYEMHILADPNDPVNGLQRILYQQYYQRFSGGISGLGCEIY